MRRGFTLVEVVMAVAIFAGSMAVMLALLPSLARQSADSADRLVAQRMGDAIRVEFDRRVAGTTFDGFAAAVPVMSVPLSQGLEFVATLNGLCVEPRTGTGSGGIAADDQRFLIEVWRFAQPSLAYDVTAATLPLYVRVSWPYRTAGVALPTPYSERDEFTFVTALDR